MIWNSSRNSPIANKAGFLDAVEAVGSEGFTASSGLGARTVRNGPGRVIIARMSPRSSFRVTGG